MSNTNQIQNIRNFINNGLRIKLTPGNPEDVKNTAFAIQNAISQIPEDAILFLMKHPNAKLRIQKIQPKASNENPSARLRKKRHN